MASERVEALGLLSEELKAAAIKWLDGICSDGVIPFPSVFRYGEERNTVAFQWVGVEKLIVVSESGFASLGWTPLRDVAHARELLLEQARKPSPEPKPIMTVDMADRSATVDLPAGWKVYLDAGHGGALAMTAIIAKDRARGQRAIVESCAPDKPIGEYEATVRRPHADTGKELRAYLASTAERLAVWFSSLADSFEGKTVKKSAPIREKSGEELFREKHPHWSAMNPPTRERKSLEEQQREADVELRTRPTSFYG